MVWGYAGGMCRVHNRYKGTIGIIGLWASLLPQAWQKNSTMGSITGPAFGLESTGRQELPWSSHRTANHEKLPLHQPLLSDFVGDVIKIVRSPLLATTLQFCG